MYINTTFLFGNLTRDPELRALPNGGSVASFGLATNRTFRKADGTKGEQTEFHNIVVFGKQAESCAQWLKKGSSAFIEGRIQTRSWEGEHGKQYRTEIVAERVQFGPRRSEAQNGAESGDGARDDAGHAEATESAQEGQSQPKADVTPGGIEYPEEDIDPDKIPF